MGLGDEEVFAWPRLTKSCFTRRFCSPLLNSNLLKAKIGLEEEGRIFPIVSYFRESHHTSLFLSSHDPARQSQHAQMSLEIKDSHHWAQRNENRCRRKTIRD